MRKVYQGYYTPKTSKWIITESSLDKGRIKYRSSWERKFMEWCDSNSSVLEVSSEPFGIPYISPLDNRQHKYYIDFYIKVKTKDDELVKYAIEVKPLKETKPPRKSKNEKRYKQEILTYARNRAKWAAAERFCQRQGWVFKIITEKELGIK